MDNARFEEGSSREKSRVGSKASSIAVVNNSAFEGTSTSRRTRSAPRAGEQFSANTITTTTFEEPSNRRRARSSSQTRDIENEINNTRVTVRSKRRRTEAHLDPVVESSRNAQGHPIILPPLSILPTNSIVNSMTSHNRSQASSSSSLYPSSSSASSSTQSDRLPPINLSREENRNIGAPTLPSIRSVFSNDLGAHFNNNDRNSEVSFIDLTNIPTTEEQSPSPDVVDLTAISSPSKDVIVIEDDPAGCEEHSYYPSSKKTYSNTAIIPYLEIKCAICLEPPSNVSYTSCGHIFCRDCITQAVKVQKMCSLCRNPLNQKKVKRLQFKVM
ncbi:4884_t:CDS:2 [Ambispora gerdemannii]|uniref:4884_t:CDS:1 n=1 Tax=Ambispora gerdemannii TaxID=144530 RepID=A0A9N8WQJ4_9GLOM|nr:4884_t:CDS:2 [Ambispora gerdemannii]